MRPRSETNVRDRSSLPPRSEYDVAAIHCLRARGGSATIEELEEDVADKLKLSEAARSIPDGDGRRSQFQYELAWVRTYLKWAGAIENSERAVWHLTPLGSTISDDELRGVWKRIVAEQRERRKAKAKPELPDDDEHVVSDVPWKERLLDVLLAIDPK